MHERNDEKMQATVIWDNDRITEWIEQYKDEHGASDSQAIKYALRNVAQGEIDQWRQPPTQ